MEGPTLTCEGCDSLCMTDDWMPGSKTITITKEHYCRKYDVTLAPKGELPRPTEKCRIPINGNKKFQHMVKLFLESAGFGEDDGIDVNGNAVKKG